MSQLMYYDTTANAWLPVVVGAQGLTGTQGFAGAQGTIGAQGTTGSTGIQGTQGTLGLQGFTGATGTQGTTGSTGIQGLTGTQGVQGATGQTGTQGTTGTNGSQGTTGSTGAQGTAGSNGTNGAQGTTGTQGLTGSQGIIGTQGATGTQGFVGTQGATGSQGTTGFQGTIGTQGTTGLQGTTGTSGSNGAQGLTGIQGLTGTQGTIGTQGFTGLQGTQGTTGPAFVTTKGDLETFSTTPTRLAVGADGQTLVADSSTSTGLRYTNLFGANKNKIINGDFFVNQRSFTSTTTSGTFGFDRWFTGFSGGTVTYSNQAFTPGAAPVAGYEGSTFARLVSASQSAAGDYATLQQKIEDARTFAGQTITYSFWAKASTGTPNVGITLVQNFGSGGSSGVVTSPAVKPITTSWARYSFNVNVPSVSGQTIGTGSALETIIFTSNGATLQASGYAAVGVQNATIDIWGVQFEAGSVATPFTTATGTLSGELAACQRYYYRWIPSGTYSYLSNGLATATTTGNFIINPPTTLRTAPTAVEYSGMRVADRVSVFSAVSSITIFSGTETGVLPALNVATTGLTQYRPVWLGANGSTNDYVGFSAEL